MSISRPGLAAFNAMEREEASRLARTWLDVPRWADVLVEARPYADAGELAAMMGSASASISDDELEQALARHPRIGERADAVKHDAEHSSREQSGVDQADAEVARRLAEGNRAYEQRFGRVFLICASGLSGEQILAALRSRLDNDDATESAVVADELRKIALLRLERLLDS